jgi:hypothetical protein
MLQESREGQSLFKLQSFIAFRAVLEKMFKEFNVEAAVERKLEKLQQSSSA